MRLSIIFFFVLTFNAFAGDFPVAERLIKHYEGFVAKSYSDKGQKAIGYGTELERAKRHGFNGGVITKAEASRVLEACIKEEVDFLKRRIKVWGKIPKLTQSALISASYNSRRLIGPKLRGHLNAGRHKEACLEMAYGHKGELYGLVKRRFMEARHMSAGFKLGTIKELKTPAKGEFHKIKKEMK